MELQERFHTCAYHWREIEIPQLCTASETVSASVVVTQLTCSIDCIVVNVSCLINRWIRYVRIRWPWTWYYCKQSYVITDTTKFKLYYILLYYIYCDVYLSLYPVVLWYYKSQLCVKLKLTLIRFRYKIIYDIVSQHKVIVYLVSKKH